MKDGFLNEKIFIIPKNKRMINENTFVTDIGFFPYANDHYRERKIGCKENIAILCVNGKGYVNGLEVESNSLVIIPKNTPHYYRAAKSVPWDIYWVHFESDVFDYDDINILSLTNRQTRSIKYIFYNMLSSLEYGINDFALKLNSISAEYLIQSIKLFEKQPIKLPEVVSKANQFVMDNINKNISLDELCDLCSVSRTKLHNLYKTEFNMSPINYFTQLKMDIASNYLIATPMSIKKIALILGYHDPYYFSRIFKKSFGVSPKIYRKEKG